MLEKLLQHNNIGNQPQILYIVGLLSKGNFSFAELKAACASADYSFSASFDGIIYLLDWLGIIRVADSISLQKNIVKEKFVERICRMLFLKLEHEKALHNFINHRNILFEEFIYVRNNLISLRFSSIRNFLINIRLFERDSLVPNQFFVNPALHKWFVAEVVPLIEKSCLENRSLKDLQETQEKKVELGRHAEEFVLSYERLLRANHACPENIRIVSEIDVGAGYDIQSYQTDVSVILDKFIEVKSYSGQPNFYWSKNEIEIAQREQDNYFLYLVNRDEMNNENYKPMMIQNPYKNVFQHEGWQKDCQSWKFQ